jgi:hypothetical protein
MIGISTKFLDSKTLDLSGDRVGKLINVLNQLKATEYISGPAAKNYLKDFEHLFFDNNIQLSYKSYPDYPVYKQLKEPFNNYVSILDLLANVHIAEVENYIWKKQ